MVVAARPLFFEVTERTARGKRGFAGTGDARLQRAKRPNVQRTPLAAARSGRTCRPALRKCATCRFAAAPLTTGRLDRHRFEAPGPCVLTAYGATGECNDSARDDEALMGDSECGDAAASMAERCWQRQRGRRPHKKSKHELSSRSAQLTCALPTLPSIAVQPIQ
ncbi:hypothetical protein GUJ93_ZPchr0012g19235 [Zizania palustris]|uniref:Uncharacterized protein n=1 Tax=Zizania palustris TaxID=103762 RepID=A0A8J5WU69_ZIZPA|nr:hypothetical protein GUJ93_ZPchr0012g19235 [Zizania palustris]